jgi:2-iminobutanoate/2-iminopropanoate deaminase
VIKLKYILIIIGLFSNFSHLFSQSKSVSQKPTHFMSKPYTPAIRSNGNLYVSGQIGLSKETNTLVTGGVVSELQQIFKNLETLLKENNSELDKIVAVTIYLTDMQDYTAVNEEYVKHFSKRLPTRTCIAVSALPLNAKIEITVIAE